MTTSRIDELDLKIIEALLDDGRVKYKDLAKSLGIDERLVSRRVDRLVDVGVIKKFTIDINWRALGLDMQALICTRTGAGEDLMYNFHKLCRSLPNIVRADTTLGAYEYVLHVISKDLHDFRAKVGFPLEPFVVNIATSIISDPIKSTNYKPLLGLVREMNSSTSAKKEAIEEVPQKPFNE